ncbi:MAG: MAPEG family protein [Roseibium sp.]|uniref:MAPEG family protein n=1 Tax=Roseibium sp. TaxID=1936156 RepID=UPI001B0A4B7E|nr:MAPEG family protein [Roseibium sp.]MBO6890997.1 MAPEG family protein [Roseibium sp.]MBO6932085.1 MAPEG family protein [Roseibium sp.]
MPNSPELVWLIAIAVVTAAMWVPYILESFVRRGVFATMGNPSPDDPPMPAWADRAKRAHLNALDNLAVFAAVVLSAVQLGATGGSVLLAVQIYVIARIAHYCVFVAGIPVARTVTFLAGFFATLFIAFAAIGGN